MVQPTETPCQGCKYSLYLFSLPLGRGDDNIYSQEPSGVPLFGRMKKPGYRVCPVPRATDAGGGTGKRGHVRVGRGSEGLFISVDLPSPSPHNPHSDLRGSPGHGPQVPFSISLSCSLGVAVTKYHQTGDLEAKLCVAHRSAGCESRIRAPAWPCTGGGPPVSWAMPFYCHFTKRKEQDFSLEPVW